LPARSRKAHYSERHHENPATRPQQRAVTASHSDPLPRRRAAATATFRTVERVHLADRPASIADCAAEAEPVPSSALNWRWLAFVFLSFATGCFLTYLFRTINALISGPLISELGLDAANLGLLTSVYFLTLAAAQIPIGALLDRYGPRRVQSALLLIAAAGAALFATSQGFPLLVVARAMIGFGVAASLTAAVKAVVLWFPRERVALLNGCMIMLGALGAVTATTPAERLVEWIGWRGLFELLAMATALAATVIYFAVPEPVAPRANRFSSANLRTIYADRRFWKIAPLSATSVGSAWALQGLWAAPWFTDVERLSREALIGHLFIMAVAVSVGALVLGTVADRLRRHGVGPQTLLAVVAATSIAAQLVLIVRLPLPSVLPWSVVAVVGAGTVLSYAILAEHFPKELAGRANGALNVFHFGWAFVVQYATGLILAQWSRGGGHYPVIAYQVAFGLDAAIQSAALVWFSLERPGALASTSRLRIPNSRFTCEHLPAHDRAAHAWSRWLGAARAQAKHWRAVALGAISLSVVLSVALAISVSRAAVAPYIVNVDRLSEAPGANSDGAPSDPQIAYFLPRFVKNVRSLSTDPVVVRSNWMDALNYVTAHGARLLSDYARDSKPFINVGLRSVTVEVTNVIRASSRSFEIHWTEKTYQRGMNIKSERYTGIAETIFESAGTTDPLKNPLGLFVDTFRWRRDDTN
jgi:type IV secretory pathway TrbF-like protein/predicted MFS family arabinose efflux permease